MITYRLFILILLLTVEFTVLFITTVFYQNCKQERQHEKEMQKTKEKELSIIEKEQDQTEIKQIIESIKELKELDF